MIHGCPARLVTLSCQLSEQWGLTLVHVGDLAGPVELFRWPELPNCRVCVARPGDNARVSPRQLSSRVPAGTTARIDTLLEDDEYRLDFIRTAIETEMEKRVKAKYEPVGQ